MIHCRYLTYCKNSYSIPVSSSTFLCAKGPVKPLHKCDIYGSKATGLKIYNIKQLRDKDNNYQIVKIK